MYTINEVPTTCTAKHITDWYNTLFDFRGRRVVRGTDEYKKWLYLKVKEFNQLATSDQVHQPHRYRHKYWLDHAFVFVTITWKQLEKGNRDVLEALGFKEVYCGEKDRDESREDDTGALYMYIANPEDLESSIRVHLRDYEAKHRVRPIGRDKFEPITRRSLMAHKVITASSVETQTLSFTSKLQPDEMEELFPRVFGVSVVKNGLSNKLSIYRLYDEHKDWKAGIPNVFED